MSYFDGQQEPCLTHNEAQWTNPILDEWWLWAMRVGAIGGTVG